MRNNDWMRFNCGDRVYDVADPRHVGVLVAVINGTGSVKWDNGFKSVGLNLRELRDEADYYGKGKQ